MVKYVDRCQHLSDPILAERRLYNEVYGITPDAIYSAQVNNICDIRTRAGYLKEEIREKMRYWAPRQMPIILYLSHPATQDNNVYVGAGALANAGGQIVVQACPDDGLDKFLILGCRPGFVNMEWERFTLQNYAMSAGWSRKNLLQTMVGLDANTDSRNLLARGNDLFIDTLYQMRGESLVAEVLYDYIRTPAAGAGEVRCTISCVPRRIEVSVNRGDQGDLREIVYNGSILRPGTYYFPPHIYILEELD